MAGDATCRKSGDRVDQTQAIRGDDHTITIGSCLHYQDRMQFIRMRYYVADTRRKDQHGNKIFALYRKPVGGMREELVAGVANMVVRYGVATQQQRAIERYVAAYAVHDWHTVRALALTVAFTDGDMIKSVYIYGGLQERR